VTENCQVDFYVLSSQEQSAERLACRLALMAWEQGHQTTVLAEDSNDARNMDELMWEYPPGRFLPHSADAGESAPIRICTQDGVADIECDVLINLTRNAVSQPERFKRLLEIVPCNEAQRTASRQKFISYRKQGLQPANHTIGQ
jgi:DNA polymerase-3 subunit chi